MKEAGSIWDEPFKIGSTLRIKLPQDYLLNENIKMKREEAEKLVEGKDLIECLEALGLIKFEKDNYGEKIINCCYYRHRNYGIIKVEEWRQGLVLMVADRIVWKSWEL